MALPQHEIEMVRVAHVHVGQRHRTPSKESVEKLAESIREIGLQTPILVRFVDNIEIDGELCDGWPVLVAGATRLAAVKMLGWEHVEALEIKGDDLDAELVEIDENLMRAELTPSERAAHLARRKEIYEQKHPETKLGENQHTRARKVCGTTPAERFTADTAAKTGKSERAVQLDTRRGEKIAPEVLAEVRGTDMDKGVVLDELAATPREQQHDKLAELKRRRENRDTLRKAGDAIVKADANEAFAQILMDWLPAERLADAIEAADACGYSKLTAAIRRAQVTGNRTGTDRPVFDNTRAAQ